VSFDGQVGRGFHAIALDLAIFCRRTSIIVLLMLALRDRDLAASGVDGTGPSDE
jgi:hypothetical protein